MNLFDAPFQSRLFVKDLSGLAPEERQVLMQLGLDLGEEVEKVHIAPLGDPLGLRLGEQVFSLRISFCKKILVSTQPTMAEEKK